MERRFNLLDAPWLSVRRPDGSVEELGLLEVVRQSGDITALAETSPPSLMAEYRLLLAIVHRALASSRGTWKDSERVRWYQQGMPIDEICGYLERWRDRFWLCHPEQPFMQVAALATAEETRDKRKPWTQMSLASANGNAPVVFDHALDADPQAIDWPLALRYLLGYLQFTPGGLVKTLRDADKAGPLVNTAAVLPVGQNLGQTLSLALHPAPLPSAPAQDLPAWERPPLTLAELRGEPALPTGPNDRYTRQTRAVLLDVDDGGQVRWLRFAAGWALGEDDQRPDPMACFREGANGIVRVSFTEGRAMWRDLPALVPAPQSGDKLSFRPAAVAESAAALHGMMGEVLTHQPLLVAGLASDKAKLLRWRMEQFALPRALIAVPDRALELRGHIALAEELHRQLRALTTDLVAGTLPESNNKETRARARELVDRGPFTSTYFAAAERELGALMERVAQDDPDGAVALWHGALRAAADMAWRRLVNTLGGSAQVLRSEALCTPRLRRLLRQQLPAAASVKPIAAAHTIDQGA